MEEVEPDPLIATTEEEGSIAENCMDEHVITVNVKQEPCDSTEEYNSATEEFFVDCIAEEKDGNNFRCPYPGCTKAFNRKWKLNSHINGHQNVRPFACEISGCNKSYQSRCHLQRHVKTYHSAPEQRLRCSLCDKTFGCGSSLKSHMVLHSKSHKCKDCNLEFRKKSLYMTHINMHRGILPFPCPDCDSQFEKEVYLVRHMKSHLLRRCDDCDFMGSYSQVRAHTAFEHFSALVCDYCSKEFRNKAILRDHILIHLPCDKREIIPCPHCPKTYLHKRNLDYHIKTHHTAPRLPCPECPFKSFTSKHKLEAHVRKNHKNSKFYKEVVERLQYARGDNDAVAEESGGTSSQDDVSPKKMIPPLSTAEMKPEPGQYSMLIMNKFHHV